MAKKRQTIDAVIDAIQDALDLAEELAEADVPPPSGKQAAIDAINQIRRGDGANAITTLEREFLPKWKSIEACRESYNRAPRVQA